MRRLALAAVALAACSNRLPPKDVRVESTFPAKAQVQALPAQLRVATFNTHFEPATRLLHGIRGDRVLQDVDVLIMQEVERDETVPVTCSAACGIGKDLGFYAVYAPGHAQGKGSHGVAVVSRAPITSAEVIELPYFDVQFNSGRRVALAVTIDHGDKPITVYAVHLDNRIGVGDRKKQLTPVLEHARRRATPVIIAGDFNTSPWTWVKGVVPLPSGRQDNNLEKLARSYGFETPVTESGPTFRYLGMRLDGIYTRGFETLGFATADAKNVSDHLALWATMRRK